MEPEKTDMDKLRAYSAAIIALPVPEMKTEDGQAIALEFAFRLETFVRNLEKEIIPNE